MGSILECLVMSSRKLEEELMEHTFYLLGALNGESRGAMGEHCMHLMG